MDRIVDLIRAKRDGEELTAEEFERLISGYTRNEVTDYQMAAFLMAGCINGFSDAEATFLTQAMLKCGQRLDLSDIPRPKVDKHSTGGVGDKVSLIAAPIAAAAGIAVPMITGRGIGHAGGTIDKLQSIPGFRSNLTLREFKDTSERAYLVAKLRESGWNISKTAEVIDTPRSNLYKKLEQYGIKQEIDG